MFPLKQKFKPVSCSPIFDEVEERSVDGAVVMVRKVDQKPLPNPNLFDLQKMVEAGVDLQQVNTKFLNPDLTPIVEALNEPSCDSNSNLNNEANHEN